ncbi:putative plasmid replication initiation protein [Klebsiella pneumoniae]|nr:putative plasmid replication initiation protein [Klebsiella pneumoniae]
MLSVGMSSFPLPRSLSRYAPAVRLRRAAGACVETLEKTERSRNLEKGRPRSGRFSIGSAPLTSITETDAQISGGETRQDYKDIRRFPLMAPSCALLFLPFGLPVSFRCYGRVCLIPRLTLSSFPPDGSLVRSPVPAFRFTGVIPLLWPRLSHSTPDTQFREGSSLQAGLYARTPRSVRLLRLIR